MGASVTINGNLALTDGYLELGNHNLIVAHTATFSGGSSASYIKINGNGVVQATQTRGTSRLYPLGYNPYLPIEIDIPAAGNFDNRTYELALFDGVYENPQTNTNLQNNNVVGKTWFVNPTAVASNVSVTVYWPQSEEIGTFDRSLSSLSYWSSNLGSWTNQNFAAANGNDPYNKTVTGVYFSPFADLWFGVGSSGSALPVEFTSFDVEYQSFTNSAILDWQTAMEENNSHFIIERSFDAANWESIGRVEGQGTTFDISDYQFVDEGLVSKVQGLKSSNLTLDFRPETVYYRLKQIDYNGQFDYSEIRTLNFKLETRNSFELWPNPTNGAAVYLSKFDDFKVFDLQGVLVLQIPNSNRIETSALKKGTYMVVDSKTNAIRLIVN